MEDKAGSKRVDSEMRLISGFLFGSCIDFKCKVKEEVAIE